jgi:hypothetical protein
MLTVVANDFWLVHGLQKFEETPKNKMGHAINLVPNRLSLLKVKLTESSCYGSLLTNNVNLITMLTDILYGNFSEDNSDVNKDKTKEFIRHFIDQGCDINEVHPVTKWGPIHTAFLFAPEDPGFVLELIQLGANPKLKFPVKLGSDVSGKPAIEIVKLIVERSKTPDLAVFKELLQNVTSQKEL